MKTTTLLATLLALATGADFVAVEVLAAVVEAAGAAAAGAAAGAAASRKTSASAVRSIIYRPAWSEAYTPC